MLEKITDRVYYMKHSEETDRPTLGLIIGDDFCVVVDAGASPKHAGEFQKEIAALKVPPVKYVIITHYHWDHVLGIGAWDTATVAHHATKEYFEKYRAMKYDDNSLEAAKEKGIYYDFAISCIKKELEDREHFTVGKIDTYYQDSLKIELGGITCVIQHIESTHTEDTTIIYVPEEKTMFLGDCIYGHTKDGIYGYDENKLFPMIDAIELYETEHYLISHEPIYSREDILKLWQQLRTSQNLAGKCQSVQEALAEYRELYQEEPSEDIKFYIKCFGLRE